MRKSVIALVALLFALGLAAAPASAFQPPGSGADDVFECTEPLPEGHPGAIGLAGPDGATARAVEKTEDAGPALPNGVSQTAWNAAFIDNPVGTACD